MRINGYEITPDYEKINEIGSQIGVAAILLFIAIFVGLILPYALGRLYYLIFPTQQLLESRTLNPYLTIGYAILVVLVIITGSIQRLLVVDKIE